MTLPRDGGGGGGSTPVAPVTSPYDPYFGVYGIDPNSPLADIIRNELAGETDPTAISDAFDYYAETFNLGPYAPKDKPGSDGSYSSTAASQAQAEAFAAAEAEKNRQFEAQQLALRMEEEKRQSLLTAAQRALEARMNVRQRAREQRVELAGNDPFRFTAALYQRDAGDGATPYDLQKTQLANMTNTALPTLNPSAGVAELQGVVEKLNQMEQQETQAPSPFVGMAEGGTMGVPGPTFGGQGYGVIVGDRSMNGDEEVVIRRPNGDVEVVPIVGAAQEGASLPSPLNLTVFPDLFKNLRNTMFKTYNTGGNFGDASNIKANYDALGYTFPAIKQGGPQNEPMFGQGYGALTGPFTIEAGLLDSGTDPAQAKQISDMIGILPNPRNAARFLSRLRPTERAAVIGLYKLAGVAGAKFGGGISEGEFDAMIQSAAAPTGQARQSLSYG